VRPPADPSLAFEQRLAQLEDRLSRIERPTPEAIAFADTAGATRVRVGLQTDGTYGLRVYDTDENTQHDATGYVAGHVFAHNQFTSNVTVAATSEATATTIVTASSVAFDGATSVEVEFFSPDVQLGANAAGNALILVLYQDGVPAGFYSAVASGGTTTLNMPVRPSRRLTPAAGVRTYSVRAYRTNADCVVRGGAGGTGAYVPGFVRIRKV
jgi:hypothetical protein